MCKGVGNLHHYQGHALACNQRYLEALAAVDDPTPGYDDLHKLTEPQRQHGRSYAGFNPARQEEIRLFAAVLAGDHIAQGFRNQDIRAQAVSQRQEGPATASAQCCRRPHAQTIARAWPGGESAALTALAGHGHKADESSATRCASIAATAPKLHNTMVF